MSRSLRAIIYIGRLPSVTVNAIHPQIQPQYPFHLNQLYQFLTEVNDLPLGFHTFSIFYFEIKILEREFQPNKPLF